MKLKLRCGGCRSLVAVSAEHIGRKARCPCCRKVFVVPQIRRATKARERGVKRRVPPAAQKKQEARKPSARPASASNTVAAEAVPQTLKGSSRTKIIIASVFGLGLAGIAALVISRMGAKPEAARIDLPSPAENNRALRDNFAAMTWALGRDFQYLPVDGSKKEWFDDNGVPHLSWRVHLLHRLGHTALMKKFKLDEPWDSPNNIQLIKQMPDVYRDADDPADSTTTRMVRVTGPGTNYPDGSAPLIKKYEGNQRYTVFFVAAGQDRAVPWTKPVDIQYERGCDLREKLGKPDDDNYVAMFLRRTRRIPSSHDKETFNSLFLLEHPKKTTELNDMDDVAREFKMSE